MNIDTALAKERPSFPFIVIGFRGEVYICDSDSPLEQASLYGLTQGFYTGLRAYDANGDRWHIAEVTAPYRVRFWTRILASTIYNPKFLVTLRWQCDGHYDLKELCDAISSGTQFNSVEQLRNMVSLCKTHDELFCKFRKHKDA
ncbi:MAG: hypothetical protein WC091_23655 [Sulfuricellaceae bacterium]